MVMDDDDDHEVAQSQDPSFLRQLAGASAHKVGYGRDQEEINRQIYEITKGTKFYEHEKRKDADWNARIEKILIRRDELLREADIAHVEAKVDRIFADMEKKRDLSQSIVHIDMDAFYANVELQHNPDLKDKPFVVVGLGIVTTASYDARKFGCRSGQAEFIAKKLCPDLILVPVDYHRVGAISRKVMGVCRDFDPNLHIGGCDEAYLNITEYMTEHDMTAADCVSEIRSRIFAETNLTASAGIAPNMMLAKICSDKNKPNGQYQMEFSRDAVMEFMRDLPVRKVPGIGRVGEKVLQALGVNTCGEIANIRSIIHLMPRKFAVDFLFETHLGLGPTVVQPAQRAERKSVGASRTFTAVETNEDIFKKIDYIAGLLEKDLETEGWAGKVVILTYKLDTFKIHTRQATFSRLISRKEDLVAIGRELIKPCLPMRMRLLGLRVTDLTDLRMPQEQGLKRFFEPSADQSPSKKRRIEGDGVIRISEPPESPSKRRREVINIDVEEEIESFEGDDRNRLEGLIRDVKVEPRITDSVSETKAEKYDDIEIPFFRPHNPATSSTYVIKNGREDATTRTTKKAKTLKPISAISRNRPTIALPSRSKSEQPSEQKIKHERPTTLPFSRTSTPSATRSRANSVQPSVKSRSSTPAVPLRVQETLTCPVCSRELETDNAGLNEHIDYCLSKGAIKEASSAAVSTMLVRPGQF